MKFSFEQESFANSPFIEYIWSTQSAQAGDFTSTAETHSGLVVTRYEGQVLVTIRGPETKTSPASTPADGEFFGVTFTLGTFMPILLPRNLMDRRDVHMPVTSKQSFWLDSSVWEIPNYGNVDVFIQRLVRAGLLVHDSVVSDALQGQPQAYSPRALQYHFVRATGLSQKVIQQIDRVHHAAELLNQGTSISDTTLELGYFDQSHLTNALKRFLGQTPAQIVRAVTSE